MTKSNTNNIVPVIVAGGSGTRLWPLSREQYPKQFLSIGAAQSILQQTLQRLTATDFLLATQDPLIICNEEHRFLVSDQLENINQNVATIMLEPAGRNTAPALTAAACYLQESDPVLVLMPADHHIADAAEFSLCLEKAYQLADSCSIVTLGVVPAHADTGYGYIKGTADQAVRQEGDTADVHVLNLEQFVEKPDLDIARQFIESGDYFWNSGIFIVRCSTWLKAIEQYAPQIESASRSAVAAGTHDGKFFRLGKDHFLNCPGDSIDYAVMEHVTANPAFHCYLIPFAGGWSDIGSWHAIWDIDHKDANGNIIYGDVTVEDTRNSLLISQNRLLTAVGVNHMIVAETADAVLVGDLSAAQDIKKLVQTLNNENRRETVLHRRVYRPWGSYEELIKEAGYQVKRLTVKPGKQLSLQLHHHRSEHWVVVSGIASVIRGEDALTLHENESVYIPAETKHRLANNGETILQVIEVQTGSYLGEDDIVRFEDDFGRIPAATDSK